MSKKIKLYAFAPEKNKTAISYFFQHLDYLLKNIRIIEQNETLYRTPVYGCGATGLFIGGYTATVGDLLLLYESKAWILEKNAEILYLFHISGSPLSGGNQSSFWSKNQQQTVFDSFYKNGKGFLSAFEPLINLKKKKRLKTNSSFIPRKLEKIFSRLQKLDQIFQKEMITQKRLLEDRVKLKELIDPKPDKNGIVAVMRYCQEGNLEALKTAWRYDKAQFDLKTKDGSTVLNFAAKQLSVLKFLIKKGKTEYGRSPVADACEVKDDIVKRLNLLKKLGADINEKNAKGEPPIVVAAESFNIAAIRWLVRYGADVFATNINNETARDVILKNKDVFLWGSTLKILKSEKGFLK